jgi:hypothetical protein
VPRELGQRGRKGLRPEPARCIAAATVGDPPLHRRARTRPVGVKSLGVVYG